MEIAARTLLDSGNRINSDINKIQVFRNPPYQHFESTEQAVLRRKKHQQQQKEAANEELGKSMDQFVADIRTRTFQLSKLQLYYFLSKTTNKSVFLIFNF